MKPFLDDSSSSAQQVSGRQERALRFDIHPYRKKYFLTREVYRFPYSGQTEKQKDYLSDEIVRGIVKIRKKVIITIKWTIRPIEITSRVISDAPINVEQIPSFGVGVPTVIVQANRYEQKPFLKKKEIIKQVFSEVSSLKKYHLTESEINQLYSLALRFENTPIAREQLRYQLHNIASLRGGNEAWDMFTSLLMVVAGIYMLTHGPKGAAFLFAQNPNQRPNWYYLLGAQNPDGQFGYGYGYKGGSGSSSLESATQNAGSDKGSSNLDLYEYESIMELLKNQENRKNVNVQVGDSIYYVENADRSSANELGYNLAEMIYDEIRGSKGDAQKIAENYGWRPENVQRVKDHVFYNSHLLDRYGSEDAEYKRFDADLHQALAWKKMENNIASPEDKVWFAHEFAESHYEQKFDLGYSEAHERAQSRFDGAPWQDRNDSNTN